MLRPTTLIALLASTALACGDLGGGSSAGADGGSGGGGGGGNNGNGNGNGGGGDPGPGEDGFDGDQCGAVDVAVGQAPPTMLLVVDQSGTMDAGFGDTDRWNAVYDTLMEDDGVVPRLQDKVRFGLELYTGNPPECPIFSIVEPALGNYEAIDDEFGPADPVNDTPTDEAIRQATQVLQGVTEPGPKFIVLATDGLPDTCEDPDADEAGGDRGEAAEQVTLQAVQGAYDAGIETFVVSVGDDIGDDHLQDVANAGSGLPIGGGENAEFYKALNPDELVSAFDDIVGGVASCTFDIAGEVDLDRADEGVVTLDGEPLAFGTDWELSTASTLLLLGDACETVKDGQDHVVQAQFPCGSVDPSPDAGTGDDDGDDDGEPDGGIIIE